MGRHREGEDALTEESSLSGHRIVATGASGEIGRAVTYRLSELGATLVLVGRDASALARQASALPGGPHEVLALDVRDERAWIDVRGPLRDAGPIHGLVTAAGVLGPIGRPGSTPVELFRDTLEVNVTGTLLAILSCLDGLVATAGSIVTYAGGGATSPLPRYTAYATSKAAVVRMTENLAVDLSDEDVRVNAIAPGFVAGAIHRATVDAGPDIVGSAYYTRTVAALESGGDPPDRAAGLTAFLLSDRSRGISGKLLSAVWDPWDQPEFQERLRAEADLATLRRIDDQFFTVVRSPKP